MSAEMQQAGMVFGCDALLHVVDRQGKPFISGAKNKGGPDIEGFDLFFSGENFCPFAAITLRGVGMEQLAAGFGQYRTISAMDNMFQFRTFFCPRSPDPDAVPAIINF